MGKPLISIITVIYNAKECLERTILSVLRQNYNYIEFIIIDGGSTDGTISIIEKYERQIKYWISEPDQGVYDAMNKGVNVATGDWFYFLGAGDILLNVLDSVAFNLSDPNTLYYGNVFRSDKSDLYDGKFTAYKLAVSNICHQAIFYPAVVFTKYKYDLKYRIQGDHALNMRCYGDKQIKFKYIPTTVCKYEGNGLSATVLDIPFFEDRLKLVRANFFFLVYWYAYLRNKIAKTFTLGHFKNTDVN